MAIMNPFSTRKKEEKPNDETSIESSLSTNNNEENNVNTEKTLNNNLSTPVEKKPTSLPTSPFNPTPQNDKVFSELFEESDNEEDELHNAKQLEGFGESYLKNDEDPIIQMIGRNIKDLRKKHPTGGIKASRYITTEVLLQASPTYFDKYLKEAADGVLYVRNKIAENGTSEAIKEAQDHPTDDTLQDKAFYTVHSLAAEFMQKSMWREEHRSIVLALICNEIVGFSRLEPLWRDKKIDEIICNGPKDVQIEIKGELFKVPGCYFDDRKQLSDLISRLYGAIGKTVAITNPTVKGRLHDKSRMFVVHESIAPDGPNFNIRRHPEAFWTPNDLVQRESSSEEMMAYIGNLIYKGASGVVIGGTHSGKAVTGDTKVRTPYGFTPMSEIKKGDSIYDHHGNIGKVLDKFNQPKKQVYAVTFSNNETIHCDLEHNWFVSTHESRQKLDKETSPYLVMTTEEMIKSGVSLTNSQQEKIFNYSIPVLEEPVDYMDETEIDDLPLHPYDLGILLNNSKNSETYVLMGEERIPTITSSLTIDEKLEELGAIQKSSQNGVKKIIPNTYKHSARESRKLLISGLIDGNGMNDKDSDTTFISIDENLTRDFIEIASSLGYVVKKEVNNETGEIVCTLSKDKEIFITEITPVKDRFEEMMCITVDTPDSTYLIGDSFITTHNTSLLNALTGFYKPKVRLVTLEDNIEMKPNPKKYLAAAMECRQPAVDRPSDRGIDMRTLVHSSMQLRPDVIIVGEVTDDAAFDLCQALNTGHAGASTIHANSSAQAIPRIAGLIAQGGLATLEGSLELISSAFDFIVATKHFPVDGSRRIVSVDEIATHPTEENGRLVLKTKPLWKFIDQGLDENKKVKGYWEQVSDISKERKEAKLLDIEKDLTWEELKELSSIPEQENKPNVQ